MTVAVAGKKDVLEAKNLDAGMLHLNHYKNKLPSWRYNLRQALIPIVRWETPHLASLQDRYRTPALDSYFANTANLGTHTFFMIILPILFWCGYARLGRAMINVLASGVFFTGFLKDFVCLPRPLSPPLQRISRSSSASLEYGFPSTHSANAVSVSVYAAHALYTSANSVSLLTFRVLSILLILYSISIILGRLYCGMHGFFDVIVGAVLGAGLALIQCFYGDAFDAYILSSSSIRNILVVTLIVLVLVRIHPEPADNCPCFDDSVAFSGVIIGIQTGGWHFAQTNIALTDPIPSTVPFSLAELGWIKTVVRIILGIFVIFIWRAAAKTVLLKFLPPVFRVIEDLGLSLPRKYFLRASEYTKVPNLRRDDNIIPPASEIPGLLTSLRHPRKRAISIGPQSEADAYEAMAFRQRRRRQSLTLGGASRSLSPPMKRSLESLKDRQPASTSGMQSNADIPSIFVSRAVAEDGEAEVTDRMLAAPDDVSNTSTEHVLSQEEVDREDEKNDAEMFSKLQKPRVRYDVEVVTKLIVYFGIGWLAAEGNPLFFEICGLGMSK